MGQDRSSWVGVGIVLIFIAATLYKIGYVHGEERAYQLMQRAEVYCKAGDNCYFVPPDSAQEYSIPKPR